MAEKALSIIRSGRIVAFPEPQRNVKSHWDFLIQEMTWMAIDFYEERRWKIHAARRLALMVQNYWRRKKLNLERYVSSKCCALIQSFWLGITDIVEPSLISLDLKPYIMVCPITDNESISNAARKRLLNYCMRTIEQRVYEYSKSSSNVCACSDSPISIDISEGNDHEQWVIDETLLARIDPLVFTSNIVPAASPQSIFSASLPQFTSFEKNTDFSKLLNELAENQKKNFDTWSYKQLQENWADIVQVLLQGPGIVPNTYEIRPPNPTIDLPNLQLTARSTFLDPDDMTLLLSLFVSAVDGLSAFVSRHIASSASNIVYRPPANISLAGTSSHDSIGSDYNIDTKRKSRRRSGSSIKKANIISPPIPINTAMSSPSILSINPVDQSAFDIFTYADIWEEPEDALLMYFVSIYSSIPSEITFTNRTLVLTNWNLIALSHNFFFSSLYGRMKTAKQCQERWKQLQREGFDDANICSDKISSYDVANSPNKKGILRWFNNKHKTYHLNTSLLTHIENIESNLYKHFKENNGTDDIYSASNNNRNDRDLDLSNTITPHYTLADLINKATKADIPISHNGTQPSISMNNGSIDVKASNENKYNKLDQTLTNTNTNTNTGTSSFCITKFQQEQLYLLSSIVSKFGINMKKRSFQNQQFQDSFQITSYLQNIQQNYGNNILQDGVLPPHPSHANLANHANQVLNQYIETSLQSTPSISVNNMSNVTPLPSGIPTHLLSPGNLPPATCVEEYLARLPGIDIQLRLIDFSLDRYRQSTMGGRYGGTGILMSTSSICRKPQLPEFLLQRSVGVGNSMTCIPGANSNVHHSNITSQSTVNQGEQISTPQSYTPPIISPQSGSIMLPGGQIIKAKKRDINNKSMASNTMKRRKTNVTTAAMHSPAMISSGISSSEVISQSHSANSSSQLPPTVISMVPENGGQSPYVNQDMIASQRQKQSIVPNNVNSRQVNYVNYGTAPRNYGAAPPGSYNNLSGNYMHSSQTIPNNLNVGNQSYSGDFWSDSQHGLSRIHQNSTQGTSPGNNAPY
ncbi:HSA family protein [Cryptosporidium andersoni]|uniref:HSA family protein n=1 Tax=Cryptosporidium andersoni TaxID=117008 RepID=A0A1J4MPW0_9CRYT|nr:HSA family protein [Cryptosporidium andersoni]